MTIRSLVHSARDLALRVPPIRALAEARYERYFAGADHPAYRGVFRTFEEARASAPTRSQKSFGARETDADTDRLDEISAVDYPVLFWLGRIFRHSSSVFEWSWSLATKYHAYKKFLQYPIGLRWTVCGVRMESIEMGRRPARGDDGLSFASVPNCADGHEILIAADSLQYVEPPSLPVLLSSLKTPPAHLLINQIPLYDGPTFVTLQKLASGFAAVRVWNRNDFLQDVTELGYRLVDSWDVPKRPLRLPLDPGRSLDKFAGLYLQRTSVSFR